MNPYGAARRQPRGGLLQGGEIFYHIPPVALAEEKKAFPFSFDVRKISACLPPLEKSPTRAAVPPSCEELRKRLEPFCLRHPIQKLELFGSVARGEEEAGSDVDLMVTFEVGVVVPFEEFLAMRDELTRLLECRVDFIERKNVERHSNEIRRRHMLRGVKAIYAKA